MSKIISKIEDTDLSRMNFAYGDIIDGAIVKNELSINYGLWSFIHSENVSSKDALQGLWNQFLSLYGGDIERINNALAENYEILDNYNGETITTIGTKTLTNVIGRIQSTLSHGATSVTLGGGTDTSLLQSANSESSAYSDSFLNDEKTTQTIASKTNSSIAYDDTSDTGEHTDTTTDSGNTITELKHGNLGVTTSQQMLTSEIELRKKTNFYRLVIEDMFLHNYLFICE